MNDKNKGIFTNHREYEGIYIGPIEFWHELDKRKTLIN